MKSLIVLLLVLSSQNRVYGATIDEFKCVDKNNIVYTYNIPANTAVICRFKLHYNASTLTVQINELHKLQETLYKITSDRILDTTIIVDKIELNLQKDLWIRIKEGNRIFTKIVTVK